VRELVEQRGVTWQKFGEETGLSKQTVYALMTSKITRLDFRTLDVLCSYFGVTPGEVFDYSS
jgi:putative transcriptional regulator